MTTSTAAARALAVAAALAVTVSAAAPVAAQDVDVAARIDHYVHSRMLTVHTPGVSIVVVEGDQVLLTRGYGLADRDTARPMTEDTPVPIASTTKGLTALAVMQLVERELVELDAPVLRYVPDFRMDDPRTGAITVRQLLTHTSGIPGGFNVDLAQDEQALEHMAAALEATALRRDPGSGYEYSNAGYSVAGLVVQRVAGVAYEHYLATNVLEPLGMTRSTFDVPLAAEWGLTTGFTKLHGAVHAGPLPLSRGNNPAAGLITTARDVGNYFIMLLNDGEFEGTPIVAQSSLDQMFTAEPTSGTEAYGLGWSEINMAGTRLLLHAGDLAGDQDLGGSGSQFVLVPERRIGVAVLANLSSFDKAEIAQDVLAILLGGEPAPRPAAPDWRQSTFVSDTRVWQAYEGVYETVNGPLRVYREADQLLGTAHGLPVEFVPQSDTRFVLLTVGAMDEALIEFVKQPDGSVMLLSQNRPIGLKR